MISACVLILFQIIKDQSQILVYADIGPMSLQKRPCVTPFNLDDSGVEYAHVLMTTENSIPTTVQPTIHNCYHGIILLYIIITIVIGKIIY